MTEADPKALSIIKRHDKMMSDRGNWLQHWQDLKDLVRPSTTDFTSSYKVKGKKLTMNIYDGTATWANEQLAAGLHSFLTNPTARWFNIKVENIETSQLSGESLEWLEMVSDIIYGEYADPDVNFNPIVHELYLDLGSFGTGVLYQDYNRKRRSLSFRAFALGDCAIAENSDGFVDTLSREIVMTRRQMEQMFGDSVPPPTSDKKTEDDREFHVVHMVFPRSDRDATKYTSKNMPFASVYVCKDKGVILRDSGFTAFPYHVPRWTKLAGETYGRSPGMNCLPDIKMVNKMSKTVIKAAEKITDPPLMVPDDGFILPIKTAPGSLMFYDATTLDHNYLLKPLETRGRPEIGLDMMNQRREHIIRCFFIDYLMRPKKKERQTTTEIIDDREEMLRQLAPVIGRLQAELLGPVIRRSYSLLNEAGRIPPAPPELANAALDIDYVSPAARAQFGTKAINIQRFLQDIVPLAEAKPEIMDVINSDNYASEMAKLREVSRRIINSPEEIMRLREQRAQQQQAAQMVESGQQIASAAKDLSVARKNEMQT